MIEHYVDEDFRYSGLNSFLRYALRRLAGVAEQSLGSPGTHKGQAAVEKFENFLSRLWFWGKYDHELEPLNVGGAL
jgi:hypothetical protein